MIRTMQLVIVLQCLAASLLSISTSGFATQHSFTRTPCGKEKFLRQTFMSLSNEDLEVKSISTRRRALRSILGIGFATLPFISQNTKSVNALDMDAFINSELDADTKNCDPSKDSKCLPKLSADEAMCKYGQSGVARGEACRRVKELGGALPKAGGTQVRSLGGAYAM